MNFHNKNNLNLIMHKIHNQVITIITMQQNKEEKQNVKQIELIINNKIRMKIMQLLEIY